MMNKINDEASKSIYVVYFDYIGGRHWLSNMKAPIVMQYFADRSSID